MAKGFSKEDENYIQKQLEEELKKDKEHNDVLETEIRNRFLNEKRKQPGYTGYWD